MTELDVIQDKVDSFEQMLDECYPEVVIGDVTFMPSQILKHCDLTAYDEMFNNYCDAEE